ncbi:MAG: hypothetical protein MZV70_04805 [Desulfobacterales bacterium]|nr:hypothetical protein [Desulfobacterales bacterium]
MREILVRRLGQDDLHVLTEACSWKSWPSTRSARTRSSSSQWGFVTINATLVYTWLVMGMLVVGSIADHRANLSAERTMSRWQNLLEVDRGHHPSEIREIDQDRRRHVLALHRDAVSLHPLLQPASPSSPGTWRPPRR